MKKFTLLEIVQSTLRSMGSDQVTDIDETDESIDVSKIAEDVYFRMMNDLAQKHLQTFAQLTALADVTHPNYCQIPSDIEEVIMIQYNMIEDAADDDKWDSPTFIEDVSEFVEICNSRNSGDSNVESISDFGGATLLIRNDKVPTYWTTFDDTYVVFDSWMKTLDTSIPADKTAAVGIKTPTWTRSNAAVPDMPGKYFPAYMEEVKSICHSDLLQSSTIHTAKANSTKVILSQKSSATKNPRGINRRPKYGRK